MSRIATTPELRARSHAIVAILKARRKRLGWSQAELARRSGIPQDTIRAIEQGRNPNLGFFTVGALAMTVGISLDTLSGTG
jgi:transcriptional regulator with XRE-family HTH domain